MFDISGWEFVTLAALGVIIFGPERLPKLAQDAGRMMRNVRVYVNAAKADLTKDLPEFEDLKMTDLTPRGLLRKTIGDEDPLADLGKDLDFRKDLNFDELRSPITGEGPVQRLPAGEIPPYDRDST